MPEAPEHLEPLLLPRPRHIEAVVAGISLRHTATIDAESRIAPSGYRLRTSGTAYELVAADDAGLRHGHATLAQLRTQYGDAVPPLLIEDAPAIATRGVMLDVSRDRIPTMTELDRVARSFSAMKLNHLQLYTEHTFAYAGYEEVWRDASPLTPDEVRLFDDTCRGLGIELAANQNCFGHLAEWLRHDRYAPLAETHGTWDFYGVERSGPFSLCPTDPASLDLVADLLDQLMPCFGSTLVNIGCDETADVGQGRSRAAVERDGRATVYLAFVETIARLVTERGGVPMFWADVALSHPERVADIPESLIPCAWGYEADSPFEDWARLLTEFGRTPWVSPGTSAWRSFTGRTSDRRANIRSATDAAARHGARGLLMTEWGDLGHRQQWPVAMVAIAEAADAAWHGAGEGYDPRAASLHVFGDRSLRVASWLDALGDADESVRAVYGPIDEHGQPTRLKNATALFEDLHPARPRDGMPVPEPGPWTDTRDRLAALRSELPAVADPRLASELEQTLAVAEFAAHHAITKRTGGIEEAGEAKRLIDQLDAVVTGHRALWSVTSRPNRLDASVAWYERVREQLLRYRDAR
ncbi:MAG: beta-N-acetylhexosaminidase [Planctomycetota bacterium]